MTVKHLQQIQRQQMASAVVTDPGIIMRFKSGFDECAAEVTRFINRLEGIDSGVKQRLTTHLHRCLSSLQQMPTYHQNIFSTSTQNCDKKTIVLPNLPGDVNNNSNQNSDRIQIPSNVHLIPSRLPTGELALLVPNSQHMSTFLSNSPGINFQLPHKTSVIMHSVLSPSLGGTYASSSNHGSAFTVVNKNQDYPSPTSTVDIVKKEPVLKEKNDLGCGSYSNLFSEPLFIQNYNSKVTNRNKEEGLKKDENKVNSTSHLQSIHNETESNYKKFTTFFHESVEESPPNQKSSFQRTMADSTTPFIQTKEEQEQNKEGFKPFQVEIPNSHLKAQISLPGNFKDVKSYSKHNYYYKSNNQDQKFLIDFMKTSSQTNFSDMSKHEISKFKKFTETEVVSTNTDSASILSGFTVTGCSDATSNSMTSEKTKSALEIPEIKEPHRGVKRFLSNSSPELTSKAKAPRISLNVTLTDKQHMNEQTLESCCKRISVIVDDSSKSTAKNNREVMMNAPSQKDMWRPW